MNGKRPNPRGHTLLIALVLATVMSLFLAMALQPIRTTSQRIEERELIYRGEHLAEGIRRFYLTLGRFPFDLEELVDHEPRFVRRLYADPMTDGEDWTLVYLSPLDLDGVQGLNSLAQRVLNVETEELNSENVDERTPGLSRSPNSVFQIKDRQITGIRSKSDVEGFAERDDSRIYSDWLFTALPKSQTSLEDLADTVERKLQ